MRDAGNPLSLLSFLQRVETVYTTRLAVTYGKIRRTWGQTGQWSRVVATGPIAMSVRPGDAILVLSPDIPQFFELHHAVSLAGAVLNTVNTRPEPQTVAGILDHSDSTLVIAGHAFAPSVCDQRQGSAGCR